MRENLQIVRIVAPLDFNQERGLFQFQKSPHPPQHLQLEALNVDFDEIDPAEVDLLFEIVEFCDGDFWVSNTRDSPAATGRSVASA